MGMADAGRIPVEEGVAMSFIDRTDAGRRLGGRLGLLQGRDVVVLGLPRGGVPVAAEVARALDAPLDVIIVRKLGVPSQPELAVGAVGEDGAREGLDQLGVHLRAYCAHISACRTPWAYLACSEFFP
jgi:predicted phosphoribosyltransferase